MPLVTQITEIYDGRRGDSEGVSKSRIARRFLIRTSNPFVEETIIAGALGINEYDSYPNNPNLIARRLSFDQWAGGCLWLGTVEYRSDQFDKELKDRETFIDPTTRPMRISGETRQIAKIPTTWIPCDSGGNNSGSGTATQIVNSAGDPYDSLPEIDDGRDSFHCIQNFGQLPDWYFQFPRVCVNQFPVTLKGQGCGIRTLKFSGKRFSEVRQEQGIQFVEVSFQLEYDPNGWLYSVPDRGFNYFATPHDYTTKTKILNKKDQTYPSVPQLLNGFGGVLANPDTANAVLLYGKVYTEIDFGPLQLQ